MDAALRDLLALHAWELRNIAHELHDDPIQVLSVAVMRLDLLATRVHDAEATERLDAVRDAVGEAIEKLRAVQSGLAPPALEHDGLATALDDYASQCFAANVEVALDVDVDPEPSPISRGIAFRVTRALFADARHRGAQRCSLRARRAGDGLEVHVVHDGAPDDMTDSTRHRDQVSQFAAALTRSVGGRWSIRTQAGDGTTAEFWLPDL
jgi:signal transduction histidine kinase